MLSLTANLIALLTYSVASIYLLLLISQRKEISKAVFLSIIIIAICFHAIGTHQLMIIKSDVDLGIHKMTSFIALIINILILVSSTRKPLHNLFILVLPLTIICIAISILVDQPPRLLSTPLGVTTHILLSIIAYSILSMAALQSLLWSWQNRQVRNNHLNGISRLLPPLQTMELLILELLWAGVILLTLGIGVGFVYLDNMFTQHLTHKTILSIFAWLIFTGLLWGSHIKGWRGEMAVKWLLTGFCLLILAYFGSKLVLEVIIN